MNAEQRQVAADLWTKPTDLSHKPPVLLLSPKADAQPMFVLVINLENSKQRRSRNAN